MRYIKVYTSLVYLFHKGMLGRYVLVAVCTRSDNRLLDKHNINHIRQQ